MKSTELLSASPGSGPGEPSILTMDYNGHHVLRVSCSLHVKDFFCRLWERVDTTKDYIFCPCSNLYIFPVAVKSSYGPSLPLLSGFHIFIIHIVELVLILKYCLMFNHWLSTQFFIYWIKNLTEKFLSNLVIFTICLRIYKYMYTYIVHCVGYTPCIPSKD